ncbi:NADP-dependent malic enzyme [Clostridiales bacterium FE2011]|nr:NADP-dependent malic enzyme [Clostridiales bacterium FE2011]QTE73843.1 NADP-dependent malic enzyme [Clostridiales bacterium FE2010]
MNYAEESLRLHGEWQGKIEVVSRVPVKTKDDLSLAYTPGVAQPCLEIQKDYDKSFTLTRRHNLVAVITDGTAVLGLGDIGPEAGMPVMEGKCALFKAFGDVDAFPICIRSKDVDEIVRTIYLISGSFGGINLEDIAAPRCFEIERRLKELCDIPVFHDDQHGTAVVVGAALINALKVVKKDIGEAKVVINGAGSAGIAIGKHLLNLGVKHMKMVDRFGILCEGEQMNPAQEAMAKITNPEKFSGKLADAMKGADVFIGVSAPHIVSQDMVRSMAEDPIIFPMANPTPEIEPDEALAAGAAVVGTGRSDHPNQINNVMCFPGLFRGALDVRATDINEEMKMAASLALAGLVSDEELKSDYILPLAFDKRIGPAVAAAVAKAARDSGVARI